MKSQEKCARKRKKIGGGSCPPGKCTVFGVGKCPNLGGVNVQILGVVNVLLANDSQSFLHENTFLPHYNHFEIRMSLGRKWHYWLKPRHKRRTFPDQNTFIDRIFFINHQNRTFPCLILLTCS